MAYTLSDPFNTLRNVLRTVGTSGLLLGGTMLVFPRLVLTEWGAGGNDAEWPLRMAGAFLLTLAVYFLLAANERAISATAMITCMTGNSLFAGVVLIAYLQQDLANLTPVGAATLILVFVVALAGAVAPLRYLRAEYRDD